MPFWESLLETFPGHGFEWHIYLDQAFITAPPEHVHSLLGYLRFESGFDFLVDITAVDYPQRDPRFDIIYILYSFPQNTRIRVKTAAAGSITSAVTVYPAANWLEREVYDMFGITFEGHPNLRRILMPEGWEGFPLRKDYSIIQQDQHWVQDNLGIESAQ